MASRGKPSRAKTLVGFKIADDERARLEIAIRERMKRTGEAYTITEFLRDAMNEKLERERGKLAPLTQATGT